MVYRRNEQNKESSAQETEEKKEETGSKEKSRRDPGLISVSAALIYLCIFPVFNNTYFRSR
jgi:hypothetical protein